MEREKEDSFSMGHLRNTNKETMVLNIHHFDTYTYISVALL